MKFLPSVLPFLLLGAAAAEKKLFSETCHMCSLDAKTGSICCMCAKDGQTKLEDRTMTSLDLNKCIGYENGELVGKKDGNFGKKCEFFRYSTRGDAIYANCDGKDKEVYPDFIANQKGTLECYGLRGAGKHWNANCAKA